MTLYRDRLPRTSLSTAELAALQAVARGATELKMPSRVQGQLLGLGLIRRPGRSLRATEAGRRVLTLQRRNHWQ
jgi:hypothetical protein